MDLITKCTDKIEYLRNEYNSLINLTNKTFNESVEKYTEYTEKRELNLKKWEEKETLYAKNEKEQSNICCDSDCKDYIEKMNQRHMIYLRFKFDKLLEEFPDEFEYFSKQNVDIFDKMLKIESIKEEKSESKPIKYSKQPILSKNEIEKDLMLVNENTQKVIVNDDSVIVGKKKYKIGDEIPLNIDENSSCRLLFTIPTLTIVIDNEEYTISPQRLGCIVKI